MADVNIINDKSAKLIRTLGKELAELDNFVQSMIVLQQVVAGMLVFHVIQYNKNPDELVEAFSKSVSEEVTRVIYGPKQ